MTLWPIYVADELVEGAPTRMKAELTRFPILSAPSSAHFYEWTPTVRMVKNSPKGARLSFAYGWIESHCSTLKAMVSKTRSERKARSIPENMTMRISTSKVTVALTTKLQIEWMSQGKEFMCTASLRLGQTNFLRHLNMTEHVRIIPLC